MLAYKLAFKNLFGAGLRTWLNVSVLSIAFVIIVFYNGMLEGWNKQARRDTKEWEIASGQLWHALYDPYDAYSLQDAHAPVSTDVQKFVDKGDLTPVLVTQATAYPQGRMINVLLKGMDPAQKLVKIPTEKMLVKSDGIPAVVGKRMASSAGLKKGDNLLIRWRDRNGTFDAKEITIVDVFRCNVPAVDNNQLWLPLNVLQTMTGMTNEATLLVAGDTYNKKNIDKWVFKDETFLLKEIDDIIKTKKASSSVISILLLAIALLAIFDTQILSIFRRQKEIGTYIALGMTRSRVIRIFTIEGSTHSLLAIVLGMMWGAPLLGYFQKAGIPMPSVADAAGVAISDSIFPYYSMGLIMTSVLLIIISATIVSYFPTRKISKMKPTEALKGKLT